MKTLLKLLGESPVFSSLTPQEMDEFALTSHQKSVRTLERQRILENTLIEVLGESDEEMQIEFQRRLRERHEDVFE